MTGSSDTRKFSKWFQVRLAERLGNPDDPYLIRWTIIIFGFSIRLHHWLKSDDDRYFHDHAANFISIVLKGKYSNMVPFIKDYEPDYPATRAYLNRNRKPVEGMFNSWYNFFHCFKKSIWYSKAEDRHYLSIPKEGAWTLLLEGRPYHKWGFYVPIKKYDEVRKLRPLRYFHKFGIIQKDDYQ